LAQVRGLNYNDISTDRNVVAMVQALEAILSKHATGQPGCIVQVNAPEGGLLLRVPAQREPVVLYAGQV
jgi:hypothetical protein